MKISTILDQIDELGALALPEFQRGYVWTRPQVRGLMESLYRRHPIGTLLVWKTRAEGAAARGDGELQQGYVSLLVDGQQRITSLFGLVRGKSPPFFEGNSAPFTDLYFNVEDETFEFFAPVKMQNDPRWIAVTPVLRDGPDTSMAQLRDLGDGVPVERYYQRLYHLHAIKEIPLHVEEITGDDKTVDVVVEIFNRVNSGGTKLKQADLALAKVCAQWRDARDEMHLRLRRWREAGYDFKLEWLLRNVNAVITGRAEFTSLAGVETERFKDGLDRTDRAIDKALNLVASRLSLDHDRVLGGRGAFPLISRLLSDRDFKLRDAKETDGLLYWYVQTFLWGRYAGSTETVLNRDLEAIRANPNDPIQALLDVLEQWRGDLRVRPGDFDAWSRGARFYPLLYLLTRVRHARDWGNGLELQQHLLGAHAALEMHHIFPKSRLYEAGYDRPAVNALANFTFLTKETNLEVSDGDPAEYIPRYEERHPGVIASHWIPMDPDLWRVENYSAFLRARRELLADAANDLLDSLRAGEIAAASSDEREGLPRAVMVEPLDEEARALGEVNEWIEELSLQRGEESYELVDEDTGESEGVILDLAWPDGVQVGLSQPVALLLNEGPTVEEAAGRQGFRFFVSVEEFKDYVSSEILGEPAVGPGRVRTEAHHERTSFVTLPTQSVPRSPRLTP